MLAVHLSTVDLPAKRKIFLFFTWLPVDERLSFPYSGDNFFSYLGHTQ
ncbi:dihydrofolate reductase [Kluyvera ascorbata]|uniref:Dihydrofolate reductase n=1 Tax=Kluyvera ascorbata TaxID=51288 RepID=A0A3N2S8C5_9ENTR|nr:dihydrofolate reductase [Kluyvera ascorbata]